MGKIFLARVRVADGLNKTISGSTINAARFKDLLIDEEAEKTCRYLKQVHSKWELTPHEVSGIYNVFISITNL